MTKRRRRTKAEMALARQQAANPSPSVEEGDDYNTSKTNNIEGRPATAPALDRWLLQLFNDVGGPWKIKKVNTKYAVLDKAGRMIAEVLNEDVAEAFSKLPQMMTMFRGCLMNQFAMTDAERKLYDDAQHGIYTAILYFERKANRNAGNSTNNDIAAKISQI